ncbi:MAG: hypothetical protein QMC16_06960 [Flavobacteriales bacterium]|jgi:hypothetical protein
MTARYAFIYLLCFAFIATQSLAQDCTNVQACNFGTDEPCTFPGNPCDDQNSLTFNDVLTTNCNCIGGDEVRLEMFDSGENGYSGTSITITSSLDGTTYGPFTLEDGGSSVEFLNLPSGCYEVSSTQDAQDDEVYFVLSAGPSVMENQVLGIPNDFQTFGVGVISGCTDPTAVNYEPNASCDSGGCYVCDVDGDCEVGIDGFLKPIDCNIITLCGPGLYLIVGLESGNLIGEGCKDVIIPNKAGNYEIRFLPIGGTMELIYEDTKSATEPTCYYVDENGCNGQLFDWKKPKKGILRMEDSCDLGWSGIYYQICDSQNNILETGSLSNAEFGNTFALGYDSFNLDDGCYLLKFFADDCFYPCQEFSLINTDEAEITGLIDGTSFPFNINSEPCYYGCIDINAVNYDINATNPCLGDNSCCTFTPVNDNCVNAILLNANEEIIWDTELANTSAFSCTENTSQDLWYSYTPDCNMNFSLDAFSSNNTVITVYEENCPALSGEEIYCPVTPFSKLASASINGESEKTYYVQISADNNLSPFGKGSLKLTESGCRGCTNSNAINYEPLAEVEDGSCIFADCPGDFDGDGYINVNDLGGFLGAFGTSCILPVD